MAVLEVIKARAEAGIYEVEQAPRALLVALAEESVLEVTSVGREVLEVD